MISLFYKNLVSFAHLFRRKNKFFNDMAKATKKTIKQCKSKFQKMEKYIFIKVYNIPNEHFQMYIDLQKQRRYLYKFRILLDSNELKKSKKLIQLIYSPKFKLLIEKRNQVFDQLKTKQKDSFISLNELGKLKFYFWI